jgi:hypothetical protein
MHSCGFPNGSKISVDEAGVYGGKYPFARFALLHQFKDNMAR